MKEEVTSGAVAVSYPKYIHSGCGEKLEFIALDTHFGYRLNCPKHPNQKEYLVKTSRFG